MSPTAPPGSADRDAERTETFTVRGMHCGSCVGKVRDALLGVGGIASVEVTREPPEAVVTADAAVPLADMNAAVAARGGYRLDSTDPASDPPPPEAEAEAEAETSQSLYPLFLIVAYLVGAVLLAAAASGEWSIETLMRRFMAGFFLVFSFFKLLDLRGFAGTFRGYDPLARRSRAYAFAYPFVELALGVAYLTGVWPTATNLLTLVVMSVGAAGVLRVLLAKRSIRCACLGTALNLPMTKVTLIEDLLMAAMAGAMLLR